MQDWHNYLPPLLGASVACFLIGRAMTAYNNTINSADINTAFTVGVAVTTGLYWVLYLKPPGSDSK